MSPRPAPSSPQAGARLARQRRTGTAPEMALRRAVHRMGLRYAVDAPLPLPGTRRRADLLFVGPKIAVFVDGCYWHGCPTHGSRPKSNADWWADKLASNARRDADTDRRLSDAGWLALRFWEHTDPGAAAVAVHDAVSARRRPPRRAVR